MKHCLIAIAAAAALCPSLQAAIIYSGPENLTVSFSDADGLYLNFETGATAVEFPDAFYDEPWVNFVFGGYWLYHGDPVRMVAAFDDVYDPEEVDESDYFANVQAGATIDLSSAFGAAGSASQFHVGSAGSGKFVAGEAGILGFEFTATDDIPTTHYGWLRFIPGDTVGTLVDWAYESTPGQAIVAGAVPEPSVLGMPAIALLGSMLVRRRRRP
jgi:hypothetical protein